MNATASRTLRNIIIRFPWLRPRCGACCAACPMWESKPQRIPNEKVGGSPISTRPKRPTRGLEQGDESGQKGQRRGGPGASSWHLCSPRFDAVGITLYVLSAPTCISARVCSGSIRGSSETPCSQRSAEFCSRTCARQDDRRPAPPAFPFEPSRSTKRWRTPGPVGLCGKIIVHFPVWRQFGSLANGTALKGNRTGIHNN